MILSIVIPVYKVEKYIAKCIDSIYTASCKKDEFEVIIVNDGTPDQSMTIVNKYVSKYSNIHILDQQNQGLSCARNNGLVEAKGDWVWFVDSDDWIESTSMNEILDCLSASTEDLIHFRIKEISEKTSDVICVRDSIDNNKKQICTGADMLLFSIVKNIDPTPIQSNIFKRSFLMENNLRFMQGIYHEDKEFAPRALALAKKVAYSPIISYCYLRRASGSITTNAKLMQKRLSDILKIYDSHKQFVINIGDEQTIYIFERSLYRISSFFWSVFISDTSDDAYSRCNIKKYIPMFRKGVIKNLFWDKDFKHFIGQVLFLISPKLNYKLKARI